MHSVFTTVDFAPVLIDSMMDMVRVIRADGSVVMINEAMKKQFGDNVGTECFSAIGCAEKCHDCMMERLKNGEGSITRERTINGRSFSIKASPLFGEDKSFMGAIEVFRDMTDEVALRERLIKANAKLMDDLSTARGLQRSMFRKRFPEAGEYSFHMGFYPCEAVGGDACDCIPLKDNKMLMYVADVSGHGVRAAMLTVYLKQEIIMLAKRTGRPDIKEMLESIRSSFAELNAGEYTYITIFMALIDLATGEITCVNAGHSVSPLIKSRDGVGEIFLPGSPICSWSDHAGGKEGRYRLEKGGRLLLYTDGMLDIDRNDSESKIIARFGEEPFSSANFIKYFKELHSLNPSDDLLMFICERKG